SVLFSAFFFTALSTSHSYPLSLHDALPICPRDGAHLGHPARDQSPDGAILHREPPRYDVDVLRDLGRRAAGSWAGEGAEVVDCRSEEHTSELQSLTNIVCRLLLEKKKQNIA